MPLGPAGGESELSDRKRHPFYLLYSQQLAAILPGHPAEVFAVIRQGRRGGLEICEPKCYSCLPLRSRWLGIERDLLPYVVPAVRSNAS
jgi:hypothetical protein